MAQVFPYEFCKISKNTFSHRTPLVAASDCLTRTLTKFEFLQWFESEIIFCIVLFLNLSIIKNFFLLEWQQETEGTRIRYELGFGWFVERKKLYKWKSLNKHTIICPKTTMMIYKKVKLENTYPTILLQKLEKPLFIKNWYILHQIEHWKQKKKKKGRILFLLSLSKP